MDHAPAMMIGLALAVGCAAHRPTTAENAARPPRTLATTEAQLAPGEQMAWDVFWQGMAVGRADLSVSAGDVRCAFHTGTLASAITRIDYQLATAIESGRVRGTSEVLARNSTVERVDAVLGTASFTLRDAAPRSTPDRQPLHTLASALGVVRAWSRKAPGAGYLWLLHRGELYRLDVFPPVRDEAAGRRALRVDAVVQSLDRTTRLDVGIWLASTPDRTPLRFVVEDGGDRVSAELVETTARLDW